MIQTLTGTEALSRRIQIINDLVALCGLRQPPERGSKVDWSKFEEQICLDDPESSDSSDNSTTSSTDEATSEGSSQTNGLTFPTDQCIFCAPFIRERNSGPTPSGATSRTSISVDSPRQAQCPVLIAFAARPALTPSKIGLFGSTTLPGSTNMT
jgi:hypothetical protein